MSEPEPVPAEDFKRALARHASGVTVVSVRDGRDDIGTTVTAFASVSAEPPLVLVSIAADSYLDEVLDRQDRWAVSLLAADQTPVASRFAMPGRPSGRLLLANVAHHRGQVSDALIIDDGVAALECSTHHSMAAGDHTLRLGLVLRVDYVDPKARPLLHLDRRYHGHTPRP
ncbi:MAG: flavin reductase [Streptosporangiales bacterium]|nr:flavin reductase [Streptosporangiales bacterium]